MPTKTERILNYLPGTFQRAPQLSALVAMVDAFGGELLRGENSLAAIMQSHWVDFADRNAEEIHDLKLMAALYGLSPREDESVEEFRDHLKRYIRTFLEGTVTVQGILRVTSEALGIRIADEYADMDTWWTRRTPELITSVMRGDDLSDTLFGFKTAVAFGQDAHPAQVTGSVDLSAGASIPAGAVLSLSVDGRSILINLNTESAAKTLTLEQLVETINQQAAAATRRRSYSIAYAQDNFLALHSATAGSASRLEILNADHDAAELLLGLLPLVYKGQGAFGASVTGTIDHNGSVDLSAARYLRLAVDGTLLAEIDCAGNDPAHTSLDEVCTVINTALGSDVASHDGHFLTLTSLITGAGSAINFRDPAAQDARRTLFGDVQPIYTGADDQPARFIGRRDVSDGIQLNETSMIRLRVDGVSKTIICVGQDPSNTRPGEIVNAINAAFGAQVAAYDGHFLRLFSLSTGTAGEVVFETLAPDLVANDVSAVLFGTAPRNFSGTAAKGASIAGEVDLSAGVDLRARHWLKLGIDGKDPQEIKLQTGQVTLDVLVSQINQVLGVNIAQADDNHLVLTSTTTGTSSSILLLPLETSTRRQFVSRAMITDEASRTILGFVTREAQGVDGTKAQLAGKADLSRGVDLRENRYLRLSLDGRPAVEIDCAGGRPRATLIDEIVEAINRAMRSKLVASHDGTHLIINAYSSGENSRVVLEAPHSSDALETLGLIPGTTRGRDATGVIFYGIPDLSGGIDLTSADHLRLAVDDSGLTDIVINATDLTHVSLTAIVASINAGLVRPAASHDGKHIILTSAKKGSDSLIEFAVPASADGTAKIFGISARKYQGTAATPAVVTGSLDLGVSLDLHVSRFLKLAVTSGTSVVIDCTAQAANAAAVTPAELIAAINSAAGANTAAIQNGRLVLKSSTAGLSGQIRLETHYVGDAFDTLLGAVDRTAQGKPALPAVLTGEVQVLSPVNLKDRRRLRVAVDDGRAKDIPIKAVDLAATTLGEIIDSINVVFPGLAAASADSRLQLTSPTAGGLSRLAVLPLRYLEVVEYPPQEKEFSREKVAHGSHWRLKNGGAADSLADIQVTAPLGTVGPTLVNLTLGWSIRLRSYLRAGETLNLSPDDQLGVRGEIRTARGVVRPVPPDKLLVGPICGQAVVPYANSWRLRGSPNQPAVLRLDNSLTPAILELRARTELTSPDAVEVFVRKSDLNEVNLAPAPDRRLGELVEDNGAYYLRDASGMLFIQLVGGHNLSAYKDRAVMVSGMVVVGDHPSIYVRHIVSLFDVTLRYRPVRGTWFNEEYTGVTIGEDSDSPHSLMWQLNVGGSQLVRAGTVEKRTALLLPRGHSQWYYLESIGARYASEKDDPTDPHEAHFAKQDATLKLSNQAHFAGGAFYQVGVFNISHFKGSPPGDVFTIFGSRDDVPAYNAQVRFRWNSYQPGAFNVNLPADLPARFGGRFNQARFGQGKDKPELYEQVVTEPVSDPAYLVNLINAGGEDGAGKPVSASHLVSAAVVPIVPLGWKAFKIPFRKPVSLTLGRDDQAARVYLEEEGLNGFIELTARQVGEWGNQIAVSARKSGPAMVDLAIVYEGARFENARQVVRGGPEELPAQTQLILNPGPVGVLQAKAAGIQAKVLRDQA